MADRLEARLRLDDNVDTRGHTDFECRRSVFQSVTHKVNVVSVYDLPIMLVNSIIEDCAMDIEEAEEHGG